MRAMAAGENRIMSVSDMEEGNARLREEIEMFTQQYEPQYAK